MMTNTEPEISSNLDGTHSTPTAGKETTAGLHTEIPPGHDWQITDWRQPPLLELEDGELSMDSLILNLQNVNHNDLCWGQNNEDPEPWSAFYSDKESKPNSYPTTFSEISSATSVSSCESLDSRTPLIKFMTHHRIGKYSSLILLGRHLAFRHKHLRKMGNTIATEIRAKSPLRRVLRNMTKDFTTYSLRANAMYIVATTSWDIHPQQLGNRKLNKPQDVKEQLKLMKTHIQDTIKEMMRTARENLIHLIIVPPILEENTPKAIQHRPNLIKFRKKLAKVLTKVIEQAMRPTGDFIAVNALTAWTDEGVLTNTSRRWIQREIADRANIWRTPTYLSAGSLSSTVS